MANTKEKPAKKIIKPGNDIIAPNADTLMKKLHKTTAEGTVNLTLDFAGVKKIDPVGLSVIIAAHNTLKNAGGKLALKNVSDEFSNLFGTIQLDQHIELQ
jgi:anti-anti-sigma factor